MVTGDNGEVIEAAGGLVWRENGDAKRIAIVHRTSRGYGDEWILPKGKFNESQDKTLRDTAVREVHEETGCDREKLRIENFAGSIGYSVGGKPKIVLFWNMVIEGECKSKKSEEIKEVKWLPISEAVDLLSYPKEKALLKESSLSEAFSYGRKPATLWRLKRIFKSTSHKRLEDEIPTFESELNSLIELRIKDRKNISPWAENSGRMIENAKQALRLCEIEIGWAYLNQAKLLSIYLLDPDDGTLESRAQATLNEAEQKLSSWRKDTVQDLLGKNRVLKGSFDQSKSARADLYTARKILTEHNDNTHVKLSTALFQLKILTLIAFVLVPSCIVTLLNFPGQIAINDAFFLLSVVLLGALGGTVSGMISVARGSSAKSIPDQLLNSWLTISKPVFGSMAALVISLFFYAGLIQLGNLTNYSVLAASFVAGFSERFFLGTVTRI